MTGSLGDAIDWVAENLEYWAGVRGESAASLRGRMNTIAFALRALSVAAPTAPAAVAAAESEDDPDAYVREQAEADPEFASGYVHAQHAAQIRAHEDLLAAVWLFIDWRYVTERLTAEQRALFADAVEASSAHRAEADPSYGEPVKVERWWQP